MTDQDAMSGAALAFIARASAFGLTVDEYADVVALLNGITQTCRQAASRELSGKRAGILARADQAAAAVTAAGSALVPARADLDGLTERLTECRRLLSEARAVDDDAPLGKLVAASASIGVLERQERRLTDLIAVKQGELSPRMVAMATAERDADSARAELARLDIAIADPFTTAEGLATAAGIYGQIATGAWFEHLDPGQERTRQGQAARAVVMQALRMSGMGAAIEQGIVSGKDRQEQRKAGMVTGDNGLVYASAPEATDYPPVPNQTYSQQSAAAESAALRDAGGGWQPAPGVYTASVRDMSGTPQEWQP